MGLLRGADDFDRWIICLEDLRNQGSNLGRVIAGTGFRLLSECCTDVPGQRICVRS